MAATSYAEYEDVAARAGRWVGIFTVEAQHPNAADVEAMLEDCNAQLDAAIAACGFDPSAMAAGVRASFKDVAAYGALARALAGVPDPPDDLAKLGKWARSVWGAAMGNPEGTDKEARKGSIAMGTFPGLALLKTGSSGPGAGDFFTEEPQYGSDALVEGEALRWTPDTAETFSKGQSL